jgi:hypothetical protein
MEKKEGIETLKLILWLHNMYWAVFHDFIFGTVGEFTTFHLLRVIGLPAYPLGIVLGCIPFNF